MHFLVAAWEGGSSSSVWEGGCCAPSPQAAVPPRLWGQHRWCQGENPATTGWLGRQPSGYREEQLLIVVKYMTPPPCPVASTLPTPGAPARAFLSHLLCAVSAHSTPPPSPQHLLNLKGDPLCLS